MAIKPIINDLYLKRRDIVSDGFDESLEYLSRVFPLKIHEYSSGKKCWTWTIPQKWTVREAWIKDSSGNELLNLKNHPLHIIGSSLAVNKKVSKEELMQHLHTNSSRPEWIPWVFKYYERDWGFCVEHNRLKEFKDDEYQVFIDAEDAPGSLKVGEAVIPGKTKDIVFLVAHLCHPAQVNDDLAGVAVLMEVAQELAKKDNRYEYRVIILPETIGSVAYLSQNEKLFKQSKYGMFVEMTGNDNIFSLQLSKESDTHIDRIARSVMKKKLKKFNEGEFLKIVGNDERVFDGPGVNIPMISLSRHPYKEYHTSADNPDIVTEERLQEAKDLILDILDVLDKDYVPKRNFKGPVFLSGYGLWVPKEVDEKLNRVLMEIMYEFEGDKSVFDIAEKFEIDFFDMLNYINKFLEKGLITKV